MRGKPKDHKESKINKTFSISTSTFIQLDEMSKKMGMNVSKAVDYALREYFKQQKKSNIIEDTVDLIENEEPEPIGNLPPMVDCECSAKFSNTIKICPACGHDREKAAREKALAELDAYDSLRRSE